jgi:hypothetical protein
VVADEAALQFRHLQWQNGTKGLPIESTLCMPNRTRCILLVSMMHVREKKIQ